MLGLFWLFRAKKVDFRHLFFLKKSTFCHALDKVFSCFCTNKWYIYDLKRILRQYQKLLVLNFGILVGIPTSTFMRFSQKFALCITRTYWTFEVIFFRFRQFPNVLQYQILQKCPGRMSIFWKCSRNTYNIIKHFLYVLIRVFLENKHLFLISSGFLNDI